MLGSTLLHSPASSSGVLARPPARSPFSVVRCVRDYSSIPKGKPLQPTWLERLNNELPFVQRTKEKLTDYCTTLDGEECCSCWEAYHELQDLEKTWTEDRVKYFLERYWNDSYGDFKAIIAAIHRAIISEKQSRGKSGGLKLKSVASSRILEVQKVEPPMHVPDGGIPKSQEEIDEEEKGKMPDSFWSNFLRNIQTHPSWYKYNKPSGMEYS